MERRVSDEIFMGLSFLSVDEGKIYLMSSLGGLQELTSVKHWSIQEDHGEPGSPGDIQQVFVPKPLLLPNFPPYADCQLDLSFGEIIQMSLPNPHFEGKVRISWITQLLYR